MFSFRRKRKDKDDVIGPSTGFMKLAKNFFRFVLFPFIYPKRFLVGILIIVLIIFILPASFGIEFNQMGEWYKQQFNNIFKKTEVLVEQKVLPEAKNVVEQVIETKVFDKKEEKKLGLVDYEVGVTANRRLLAQNNNEVQQNEQKAALPLEETVWVDNTVEKRDLYAYKKLDNLALNYLDRPEEISGPVEIITPNELIVNGKRLFLYGVYVMPNSKSNVDATKYMYENYEGKDAKCKIVAYSKENVATAVCVCDGVSVNQQLVELNFSDNIALY